MGYEYLLDAHYGHAQYRRLQIFVPHSYLNIFPLPSHPAPTPNQHYAIHRPEPHILLFRRRLGTDPQTGKVDSDLQKQAKEEYESHLAMNARK